MGQDVLGQTQGDNQNPGRPSRGTGLGLSSIEPPSAGPLSLGEIEVDPAPVAPFIWS